MKKIIVIVGPTAVGKTALSIQLAKKIPAEIINGDAMQVYKGMNIGTGKITQEEMEGIPHHMLDIKEPDESFSVAEYKRYVQAYIEEISRKGKIPIIVGGSGLYIQAVLYDYTFQQAKRDEKVTERLERELKRHGVGPLYERLQQIDPVQAKTIHPNNHRRVIRALEIYETTGLTMSEIHAKQQKSAVYDHFIIGLEMDRKLLYERINARVDEMLAKGLVAEVRKLYEQGLKDTQAIQAIGYKELIPYFMGETDLETAIATLKRNTRRFAKRQFTWFKNKLQVNWYDVGTNRAATFERIFQDVQLFLQTSRNDVVRSKGKD